MKHLPLLVLCVAGVAVRLIFLLLAGDLELQSDEANYVYLALSWNHFGFYSDSYRYLWPPGYSLLLGLGLQWFGMAGLALVKLVQVLASASVGMSTMLFANRLFGERAARIAGVVWIVYLPLIGFTHYLWSEPIFLALFMPAIYLLLVVLQDTGHRPDRRLIGAGLLFAGALYVKEAPQYLAVAVAFLLMLFPLNVSIPEGLRRASLFLLTIVVVVLPWTLRNYEVYGRFVPMATSLGENAYRGLNESYQNFDLIAFNRVARDGGPPERAVRSWFVEAEPGSGWERAEQIVNTPDRLQENFRRGIAYAGAHPGWFVRSRIKKLADLTAPMSFFLRHQALGLYDDGVLGAPGVRQGLTVWALLCPLLLLLLAIPGYFWVLEDRAARWLIGSVGLYFVATSLIVAMSRFRIPVVPLLVVLVAGLLSDRTALERARDPQRLVPVLTAVILLLFLWWVDLPETTTILGYAWSPTGE